MAGERSEEDAIKATGKYKFGRDKGDFQEESEQRSKRKENQGKLL